MHLPLLKFAALLVVSAALLVPAFAGTPTVEEQIKGIARRYNDIENQLGRAVHYSDTKGDIVSGTQVVRDLWLNEAGDRLKLAIEEKTKETRSLTETFFGSDVIFVLKREEKLLPDGSAHVFESRKYFGAVETPQFTSDCALIRELTKEAVFKPGESMDTKPVKNVVVELGEEARSRGGWDSAMDGVVTELTRGKPVNDPAANAGGDSARYRPMQETESPDGRYVLGWAPDKKDFDWNAYRDEETGSYDALSKETEKSLNYLVDLKTHRILGQTGCKFDGTRPRYNHRECEVNWSPKGTIFVQATRWKWYTDACSVGIVKDGTLVGVTDLLDPAEERAYAFLSSKKDSAFRKHGRDFAVTIQSLKAQDDGTVEIDVLGEIPKSLEEDSEFLLTERFRVRTAEKGIVLSPLAVSYGSE